MQGQEQQELLLEEHANSVLVAKTISIFYGLDHIISIMPARSIWSERQANNPCPFRARTRRRDLSLCVCVPPYHVHASALKADTARPWGMWHAAWGALTMRPTEAAAAAHSK